MINHLSFRQLSYFIAVAEELSFTAAALKCNVSQPPISQAIKELENQLGARLIDRSTHHVALTPAGERLAAGARQALTIIDNAADQAKSISAGLSGTIRLGVGGFMTFEILPRLVRRAREVLPNVEITFHNIPVVEQIDAINKGLIDVGVVLPPVHDECIQAQLMPGERVIAALPDNIGIARGKKALDIREIASFPIISYESRRGSNFYSQMWAMFTTAQCTPNIVQFAPSTQSAVGIVACGAGIALVPASARRIKLEGVVFREVKGIDPQFAYTRHALGWHRDRNDALLRGFIDVAREMPQTEKLPAADA